MKKLVILVMTLAFVAGCCSNPINPADTVKSFANCVALMQGKVCTNRTTIQNWIAGLQATIASIELQFGAAIPPEYLVVIAAAKGAIATAQGILDAFKCPTDDQVIAVTSDAAEVAQTKFKATMKYKARMGLK